MNIIKATEEAKTMNFSEAMKEVGKGKKIKRKSQDFSMQADRLTVADILATDWEVVDEYN